jgi:hypothetical protein
MLAAPELLVGNQLLTEYIRQSVTQVVLSVGYLEARYPRICGAT